MADAIGAAGQTPGGPAAVQIPLRAQNGTLKAYALVDATDVAFVNQWAWRLKLKDGNCYATRHPRKEGRRTTVYMHKAILEADGTVVGEIDHENHDGLDNRRRNLRPGSHQQNMQNRPAQRGSSSRFRGVHWDKRYQCWAAGVRMNGRRYHLGSFDNEEEAGAVAAAWRAQHMPGAVESAAADYAAVLASTTSRRVYDHSKRIRRRSP